MREGGQTRLSFTDTEGEKHEAVIGQLPDTGDAVPIRYLRGDPERVRLEADVHPAWIWGSISLAAW